MFNLSNEKEKLEKNKLKKIPGSNYMLAPKDVL
jgi:hypothetical protein